jgi:hypothetical protein
LGRKPGNAESLEYYSAGYQPEFLLAMFNKFGMQVLHSGRIRSERMYFMTHALKCWPTENELKHPITKYPWEGRKGTVFQKSYRFIKDLPGRYLALYFASEPSDSVETATESFILGRKF